MGNLPLVSRRSILHAGASIALVGGAGCIEGGPADSPTGANTETPKPGTESSTEAPPGPPALSVANYTESRVTARITVTTSADTTATGDSDGSDQPLFERNVEISSGDDELFRDVFRPADGSALFTIRVEPENGDDVVETAHLREGDGVVNVQITFEEEEIRVNRTRR